MQELPPRDRISLFKGQCELLSNNLFSASRLTRGPQSLLGPQPGDMGRRESHKARSIVNWSPSLLLWSLAFLLCQNLLLTSASWYHPPFPEATENLGWMFFLWEELKSASTEVVHTSGRRKGEPDTCPPSLAAVLALGALETVPPWAAELRDSLIA